MPTKYDYLTGLPLFDCSAAAGVSNTITAKTHESACCTTNSSACTDAANPPPQNTIASPDRLTIVLMPEQQPPMPECIMEREKKGSHYTTVKWNDGTYTTVKASDNDEGERSPYMAFCAALAKKIYGSNSAVHRVVNRHLETYLAAEKKKSDAEKRAKEAERMQAEHERKLLKEAARLRLKDEAKAYNRAHRYEED